MVKKLFLILAITVLACSVSWADVELDGNGDGDIDIGFMDEVDLEALLDHDDLNGFVVLEHIDWSADQGATNIHSGNIPDLSSIYAAALGVDDNYVTDAEKTVIGNTSGTNTGDQDLSGKEDALGNPGTNGYVLSSLTDGTRSWVAAGSGGATAWDDITDPDAADEIDFGSHIIELNVEDFRIGDGGSNYVKFSDTGITFAGTYGITTQITLTDQATSPDAVGEFFYENDLTGLTDGGLTWHDGTTQRYIVDLDTLPSDDDYVVSYDADADKFYMKADDTGAAGTPSSVVLDDDTSVEIMADADGMDDDEHNGITITGRNAGEALTQWDLVRLANDADPWHQADADAAGEFPAIGIVVASTSDTNEAKVLITGVVRNEGWTGLTPGGKVYLSDTAGGITQTAPSTSGDCVQVVGFALSDSEIFFDFSRPYSEVE